MADNPARGVAGNEKSPALLTLAGRRAELFSLVARARQAALAVKLTARAIIQDSSAGRNRN